MFIKRILLLPALLLFLSYSPLTTQSSTIATIEAPQVETKTLDPRAEILQAYLAKYNSPLQYHAQDFIEAADTYDLDWKLVPAISGVESTFGKAIPGGYNAWGWGVYGDQALGFESWRDGIFTVTGGLRKGYFNKGLTDPYSINKVYAASPTWGAHVSYFLADLSKFVENYNSNGRSVAYLDVQAQPSGPSAQLR